MQMQWSLSDCANFDDGTFIVVRQVERFGEGVSVYMCKGVKVQNASIYNNFFGVLPNSPALCVFLMIINNIKLV